MFSQILFIFGAIFCCSSRLSPVEAKSGLSNDISFFFETTLYGCTIRVILDPWSEAATEGFNSLNSNDDSPPIIHAAYIINRFKSFGENYLPFTPGVGKIGYSLRPLPPDWLQKRHNGCSAHLYFIQNEWNLRDAVVYHFIDFNLKKESPNFIIFWNIGDALINYGKYFKYQEFYGTFTDYRIWIDKQTSGFDYAVSLVCIICVYKANTKLVYPVHPSRLSKITEIWNKLHSDHYGYIEFACDNCLVPRPYQKSRKQTLEETIQRLFNASLVYSFKRE